MEAIKSMAQTIGVSPKMGVALVAGGVAAGGAYYAQSAIQKEISAMPSLIPILAGIGGASAVMLLM